MSEALDYLQSKGLSLKQAGPNEVHFACIFCGEDEGKRGRLYVNVDPNQEPPGQFKCHLCNETGALLKLKKKFGDPVKTEEAEDRSYKLYGILQDATEYYHEALTDNEDAFLYLKRERGLTAETIVNHKLGWADGGLRKHLTNKGHVLADMVKTGLVDVNGRDFLHEVITIPYLITGNTVMIRGKQIGGKYLTPPAQKTRLYNSDVTWSAETVVVTEGEFDALVIEQIGYEAVGAPGATSWQANWNDYFKDTKRVLICYDNDTPGQAGAEKLASSLGTKARIIHMPEAQPGAPKNDPSEWIGKQGHSKDDFEFLIRKAKGGLLITPFEAYQSWQDFSQLPGLKLGWEKIDRATGGLKPTQIAIVLANTGVGKTLWTINTMRRMIELKDDIRILFISLEQTKEDWAERALRIARFHDLQVPDEKAMAHYLNHLVLVEKNDLSEAELVNCIDQFAWDYGEKPHVIFVDYLGYWARHFGTGAYERMSDAVHSLKRIAKSEHIVVVAPHQVNRGTQRGARPSLSAGRDSGAIEETADLHMSLWREDQQDGRDKSGWSGQVKLIINKSRNGGDGEVQSIWFAPSSLAMIPHESDSALKERQEDDLRWTLMGDEYAAVMFRHLTQFDDIKLPQGWKESVRRQWPTIPFENRRG